MTAMVVATTMAVLHGGKDDQLSRRGCDRLWQLWWLHEKCDGGDNNDTGGVSSEVVLAVTLLEDELYYDDYIPLPSGFLHPRLIS